MTIELQPYADTKESGLPWLGAIPAHWELVPNRSLIRRRKVLVGARQSEYRLLSLTKQGIIVRDVESGKGKFSADMGTFQEVRDGDLVFCLFDIPETPRTVGLSRHDGMITGAYTVFKCSDEDLSEYFELFYRAMDDRKLLRPLYSGLRNTIPPTRFLGIKTPVPPDVERAAIVRYLDYMSGRTRRNIVAKQKLIKLLDEQMQAVIHRAVTSGIAPDVSYKASGVDWLGDVPQHWELRRISACIESTRAGFWGDDPTPENVAEQIVCVRVADFDVERLGVRSSKFTLRAVPPQACVPRLLAAGDILLEKSGGGDAEPVGRVVAWDQQVPAISSNFVTRLRPNRSMVDPRFLLFVLAVMQSTRRNVPCIKQTTGIQNLDERAYLSLQIAVPPVEEQGLIAAELRERLDVISAAKERARREIELLQEYLVCLVANVVSGKLDVREASALLPKEISHESEMLDEAESVLEDDSMDSDLGRDVAQEEVEV